MSQEPQSGPHFEAMMIEHLLACWQLINIEPCLRKSEAREIGVSRRFICPSTLRVDGLFWSEMRRPQTGKTLKSGEFPSPWVRGSPHPKRLKLHPSGPMAEWLRKVTHLGLSAGPSPSSEAAFPCIVRFEVLNLLEWSGGMRLKRSEHHNRIQIKNA